MKKIGMIAMTASLFAMSAMAEKWSGTISDAKCGMAHADASEKSMKCVQGCVKGGQAPVFVVDGKVLKISDDSKAKVMDHLGHKVEIDGKLEGDVVTVKSVKMPKA
ncbi:hypothetical protein F183_A49240 [Bryobacterales bacterium F-183]|nr:hypothetical protein F183_A49240 [Bryobacterales bacterium F-183]